jgi:5'-nucleotidase/UDP-sugar diphosphatase
MKRYTIFLVICLVFAQAVFGGGTGDSPASQNPGGQQCMAEGIGFTLSAYNPRGSFEKLYAVREESGSHSAPEELTRTDALATDMNLTVFHFNDLHGHMTDQDSKRGDTHRVAQMVKIVDAARKNADERNIVLFFSAGDEHTGTPFDELLGWNAQEFIVDPAYRILSAAGVDATVVGNHEVDRGYELLAKGARQDAAFPVLSANIVGSRWATPDVIKPAAIGIAKGLRIGLIGLTTPEETREATVEDPNVRIAAPLESIEYYLPRMEPFVDVFVVLSHLGFEGEERHRVSVGDRAIAEAASRCTGKPVLVIGGHTHSVLNKDGLEAANIVEGIPLLQAGSYGAWLGRMDVSLARKEGGYAATDMKAALLPIKSRDDRVASDQKGWANLEHEGDYDGRFEKENVEPILTRLAGKMKERLGRTAATQGFSTERILAERYVGECGMANYMNDMIVARSANFPGGPVDLAVFNASGIASGVDGNTDITFGDWFKVMPYADNIVIISLSGAQLLDVLRSNAQRLVRPEELAGTKPVALDGFVSRGFLHFSSDLRYEIRLGANAEAATVENASFRGVDLRKTPDKIFRIAFSTYIANGFEGWKTGPVGAGLPQGVLAWDLAALDKLDTGLVYRNEIIAGIKEWGRIAPFGGAAGPLDGRVTIRQ